MIFKVMLKDLLLNRTPLLLNLVILEACLLFFAVRSDDLPPHVFAGFAGLMGAFIPVTIIILEDKFKAMAFGCSLPVKRKTIVQARFLLSLGASSLLVTATFLLAATIPGGHFRPGDLFAGKPLLVSLAVVTLVLSFLLPFSLRFGMAGIMIFLVTLQVLGIVLFTVARATRSAGDKSIVRELFHTLGQVRESMGDGAFHLLAAVFLLGLLGLSYGFSVRLFEKREF